MASITQTASASLAQTFTVSAPSGVSGIYVPSVDLFFQSASKSFGVTLSIVGLTNGLPDVSMLVPGATATLLASQVTTSVDGSVATNFAFSQLVFLQSNTTYAILVTGLGATPDYKLWTALSGDVDITTGIAIASIPASGTLYYAKNSTVWAQIAGESLKYSVYRCKFNYGAPATAVLMKSNTEILILQNNQFAVGVTSLIAGDEVWGLVTDSSNNTIVDPTTYAKVYKYDPTNMLLYCQDSTGNFKANTNIQIVRADFEGSLNGHEQLILLSQVKGLYDPPIDGIIPKIGGVTDSSTGIAFTYQGTVKAGNGAYTIESTAQTIPLHNEKEFLDNTRYFLSRTDERVYLAGNSSINISATMSSNNDFMSPIIDVTEHGAIGYNNQINNLITGEQGAYGKGLTRYIGKTVTLAEGMDAETLDVYLNAYKPAGTELYAYAKIWNSQDPNQFDDGTWTRLVQVTNVGTTSDPNNTDDYREYEYQFPNAIFDSTDPNYSATMAWQPLNAGVAQTVQYQSTTGTYYGFKSFAIKVVLASTSNTSFEYPRLTAVRAIALML